jgi:hypothetical protein
LINQSTEEGKKQKPNNDNEQQKLPKDFAKTQQQQKLSTD